MPHPLSTNASAHAISLRRLAFVTALFAAPAMFTFFETRIQPTRLPTGAPPPGLLAFYWHFILQTRGLYMAMFVTGLCVALIDTVIPVFIGKLVTLMQATDRATAFADATPALLFMAALVDRKSVV